MTLEQYASAFEILASVAVVVSLIFVGIQLARGNREARLATLQAAMFREMDNSFQFAQFAATWNKVISGQPLVAGEELRRGIGLFNAFMTDCEYRYRQFKAGYLDQATWDARDSTLPDIVRLPIFSHWRAAPSGKNHSSEFLSYLEQLLSSNADRET